MVQAQLLGFVLDYPVTANGKTKVRTCVAAQFYVPLLAAHIVLAMACLFLSQYLV